MQQERAVGGVEHPRALDRVHAAVSRGQSDASLVSTVMSRIVCQRLDPHEVDRADRPARLADRARDLSEHPRQVVDLHAQREAVLSARGTGIRAACYARAANAGTARAGR